MKKMIHMILSMFEIWIKYDMQNVNKIIRNEWKMVFGKLNLFHQRFHFHQNNYCNIGKSKVGLFPNIFFKWRIIIVFKNLLDQELESIYQNFKYRTNINI